jgi:hypothetical protein
VLRSGDPIQLMTDQSRKVARPCYHDLLYLLHRHASPIESVQEDEQGMCNDRIESNRLI